MGFVVVHRDAERGRAKNLPCEERIQTTNERFGKERDSPRLFFSSSVCCRGDDARCCLLMCVVVEVRGNLPPNSTGRVQSTGVSFSESEAAGGKADRRWLKEVERAGLSRLVLLM